ncbi:MAG: Flp pilus assembly complex ATPase component TadA [Phycisphaerae bacterium]|nr:Flp pilus assembly complex ATPase component TadA [Phycisphaerae bacterium]
MDALASSPNETVAERVGRFRQRVKDLLQGAGLPSGEAVSIHARLEAGETPPLFVLNRLFDLKAIDEATYQETIAQHLPVERMTSISTENFCDEFVRRIPISFARRHKVIALDTGNGPLTLVCSRLKVGGACDHVGAYLRRPFTIALAPQVEIERAINQAYAGQNADFAGVLGGLSGPEDTAVAMELIENGDLLDSSTRAPVIKLVNMVLFEAVKRRASDVHIQPFDGHVQVRFRIDGVLYDFLRLPSEIRDEVVSRIKVVGGMDIAEKRIAQDGRTTVSIGDRSVDLRISVIPTSRGERVVLRLLDKSARLYELGELGMSVEDRARFATLLQRTHGIILVTGPTGSGKSTTLYAALQHLDSTELNILTLEDPIEYQLPGISQTQVSTKKGMNFATGLRAVLRQDPDVILVGEIRDEETARMAVQSSMTGHLVLSTLHTNDAAGAVTRLLDLGIEPYLVASSLVAVLALRLIRVVCPQCCVTRGLSPDEMRSLQVEFNAAPPAIPVACGCEHCSNTGYFGRTGIFELLIVDEAVRELITSRAKSGEIKQAARRAGMKTLREDGLGKLLRGTTTADEVQRITLSDEGAGADSPAEITN